MEKFFDFGLRQNFQSIKLLNRNMNEIKKGRVNEERQNYIIYYWNKGYLYMI